MTTVNHHPIPEAQRTAARRMMEEAISRATTDEGKRATAAMTFIGHFVSFRSVWRTLKEKGDFEVQLNTLRALLHEYLQLEPMRLNDQERLAVAERHFDAFYREAAPSVRELHTKQLELEMEARVYAGRIAVALRGCLEGKGTVQDNLDVCHEFARKLGNLEGLVILQLHKEHAAVARAA